MPTRLLYQLSILASLFILTGCAASVPSMDLASGPDDIATDGDVPTHAQYQDARDAFVGSLQSIIERHDAGSTSAAASVRNGVIKTGVILGLVGTVSSFAVKNEDTKATVAQLSSIVGGITGVMNFIPYGKPSELGPAASYLKTALPQFESKWPANLDRPLTVPVWNEFAADSKTITSVLDAL